MRCADCLPVARRSAPTDLQRLRRFDSERSISSGVSMASVTYDKELTALLVIGRYNDFISEGGKKLWDRLKAVAEASGCVPHMLQVLNAARRANLRVLSALHHRYRPGDYETWKYIAPVQRSAWL